MCKEFADFIYYDDKSLNLEYPVNVKVCARGKPLLARSVTSLNLSEARETQKPIKRLQVSKLIAIKTTMYIRKGGV